MKKLIYFLLLLPVVVLGQIDWSYTYSFSESRGLTIKQTYDDGFIIGGVLGSDILLLKTDESGIQQWSQVITSESGGFDDFKVSVQQTTDGGFILSGTLFNDQSTIPSMCYIKTNELGEELWRKNISEEWSYNQSIIQLNSGGYVLLGYNLDQDILIINTNESGDEEWSKSYGGTGFDWGFSIQETNDGGFIITGFTSSFLNSNTHNVYLIKTNENGDEEWSQVFEDSVNETGVGYSIQQTLDNGFIICGDYLIKTDSNGQELWSKSLPNQNNETGVGYSVQQTLDNGFIICGKITTSNNNSDIYLMKTNSNGEEEWSEILGGQGYDSGKSIIQTMDGGYVFTGWINDPSEGRQLFLTKIFQQTYFEIEINGCDSIQNIVDTTFFYESGYYTDTIINQFGGDSIITQNVIIENTISQILLDPISISNDNTVELYNIDNYNYENTYEIDISGGQYILNDSLNHQIIISWDSYGLGTINFIETSPMGCSSLTLLNVNITPPTLINEIELIGCDSIEDLFNNSFIFQSEIFIDTLINQYGGDSILTQNITINQSPETTLINGNNIVTPSSLHYYQITNTTENNLEWSVEGGSIFQDLGNIIEILWGNEGDGTVELTETNDFGCSTTNILEVSISDESTSIDELTNSRRLIKTINVLGNEITPKSNTILIQFYDDGSVEKKLIIE